MMKPWASKQEKLEYTSVHRSLMERWGKEVLSHGSLQISLGFGVLWVLLTGMAAMSLLVQGVGYINIGVLGVCLFGLGCMLRNHQVRSAWAVYSAVGNELHELIGSYSGIPERPPLGPSDREMLMAEYNRHHGRQERLFNRAMRMREEVGLRWYDVTPWQVRRRMALYWLSSGVKAYCEEAEQFRDDVHEYRKKLEKAGPVAVRAQTA